MLECTMNIEVIVLVLTTVVLDDGLGVKQMGYRPFFSTGISGANIVSPYSTFKQNSLFSTVYALMLKSIWFVMPPGNIMYLCVKCSERVTLL